MTPAEVLSTTLYIMQIEMQISIKWEERKHLEWFEVREQLTAPSQRETQQRLLEEGKYIQAQAGSFEVL